MNWETFVSALKQNEKKALYAALEKDHLGGFLPLSDEERKMGKIPAIKSYYQRTGCTLKDAKDYYEKEMGR